MASQSKPGNGWGKSDAQQAARRSVYVFVKRTLLVPELEVLDFPDTNGSCEQRVVSTVAPQALTWINGSFIREQAQALAARLRARRATPTPHASTSPIAWLSPVRRPMPSATRSSGSCCAKPGKSRPTAKGPKNLSTPGSERSRISAWCF